MQITTDVNWEIQPARETHENGAYRFDQATQGDQPVGSEPENPAVPAPETDGQT